MPSAFVAFGIEKGFFEKQKLEIELQPTQGGAADDPGAGERRHPGRRLQRRVAAAGQLEGPADPRDRGRARRAGGRREGLRRADRGEGQGHLRARGPRGQDRRGQHAQQHRRGGGEGGAREGRASTPGRSSCPRSPFPEMAPALAKGSVDAAFSIEPFVTAERAEGRRGARLLLRRHRVRHAGRRLRGDRPVRRAEPGGGEGLPGRGQGDRDYVAGTRTSSARSCPRTRRRRPRWRRRSCCRSGPAR